MTDASVQADRRKCPRRQTQAFKKTDTSFQGDRDKWLIITRINTEIKVRISIGTGRRCQK